MNIQLHSSLYFPFLVNLSCFLPVVINSHSFSVNHRQHTKIQNKALTQKFETFTNIPRVIWLNPQNHHTKAKNFEFTFFLLYDPHMYIHSKRLLWPQKGGSISTKKWLVQMCYSSETEQFQDNSFSYSNFNIQKTKQLFKKWGTYRVFSPW